MLKVGFDYACADVKPVSPDVAFTASAESPHPQFPAKGCQEAISYIKGASGQVSFCLLQHRYCVAYAGAILETKAGLDMQHVALPGSAPALAQVMEQPDSADVRWLGHIQTSDPAKRRWKLPLAVEA